MLKACINGARRRSEHPALPITALELAEDVAAVASAGAHAVHLHVKDASGQDTLAANALDEALSAVRPVSAGLAIGVTTGAWAAADPESRVAAIRNWHSLPDFASVNWHEDGAEHVAVALLERGVGVEAGLWNPDAATAWVNSPLQKKCFRVLLELPDSLSGDEVEREVSALLAVIGNSPMPELLLHGEGASAWPALRLAHKLGMQMRIGLEDVLTLPDGSTAGNNAALVQAALALVRVDESENRFERRSSKQRE